MTRDTRTQLVAFAFMLAFFAASASLAVSLTGTQGRYKLTYTDRAEEGQSPQIALGIAMGAFRGIFVNFLWIRANDMKQEGKFFEAVQLAQTITKLQPRFPRVWVFHAWNLSYNISVQTQTPEERWQWVNRGIELLRDEGIPANPNDMLLHKELGWIFLHKIGGFTDDANGVYKRMLAKEWTVAVGPPPQVTPETSRDREAAIASYVAWIQPYADAPDTLEGAIEKTPKIGELVSRLRDLNMDLNWDLLGRYEVWNHAKRASQRELLMSRVIGPNTQAMGALVDDPQFKDAWTGLLAHMRRRVLIDKYHMDPQRMVRYMQKYGPIDWRHHAAHGVYWGQTGVENSLFRWTEANKDDYDFINTDRIVAQSVQDLFRTGELYFDFLAMAIPPFDGMYQGVPNAHFVQAYGDILDEQRSRSWADRLDSRGFSPLSAGYENFLRDAICFFYRRGDMREAERWRERLRKFDGANMNDQERRDLVSQPLELFVRKELATRLSSPSIMINQVAGSIIAAYQSGLLQGDQPQFLAQIDFAKMAHKYYMEQQLRSTVVTSGGASKRMAQLSPNFPEVTGVLFAQYIQGLGLDQAELVYDRAPNDLRQWGYDVLRAMFKDVLEEIAKAQPDPTKVRTFEQIFPEPKGMEEFRKDREAERRRPANSGVEMQ
jgi:hypothetical protein